MSQRKKLLERAQNGADLNGEDFRTLARAFGIEVRPSAGGGSHFGLYCAPTRRIQTVTVPGAGAVKRCYVKALLEIIEEIESVRDQTDKGENGDERE